MGKLEEGGKYAKFIKNWTVSWVIGQHQCQQFYWTLGPPAIVVVPQKTLKNPVIVLKEEIETNGNKILYITERGYSIINVIHTLLSCQQTEMKFKQVYLGQCTCFWFHTERHK